MSVTGIFDANYHQENPSIAGAMIMIGNVKNKRVEPVYWKSGLVNRVCTYSKASETRGVMLVVDDVRMLQTN